MYKSLQKTSFPYIHCWNVLRYAPKFCEKGVLKKKTNISDGGSPTFSSNTDLIDLEDNDTNNNELVNNRPIGRKAAKECAKKGKGKITSVEDDTKEILIELRDSQKQQRDDRKATTAEFLKIEKEREEREKKKEEREQMLYEQRILAIDISNMSQYEVEYYASLKEAIIDKRRNVGFTL